MKILFLSKEANGLDMAMRLSMEGNEVRVWQKEPMPNFDGICTKVADYRYHLKWADMIFLDDTGLLEEAYEVQKTGKPAYGMGHVDQHFELFGKRFHASAAQDHLEHDRTMVHSLMEHLGIGNSIEAIQFKDVAEAIQHVKDHPVPHVVKMECSTGDSGKTYVGEMPDGQDVIGWLEAFPKMPGAGTVDSISLEERKDGVEVACSAWFNGQDFVLPVNINFEHKKIATGNLGFNCYSEDTEVLTKRGWLTFDKVSISDSIASYNTYGKCLVWENPTSVYWKQYSGEMVSFSNRYVDLLVTPNHRMLYKDRKSNDDFYVDEARNLMIGEHNILQSSWFNDTEQPNFTLPSFVDGRGYTHPEVSFDPIKWARLLGWYLSEGNTTNYDTRISQKKIDHKWDILLKDIESLNLRYCYSNKNFQFKIYGVQLSSYLKQFGLSGKKFIPDFIKHGSRSVKLSFLDTFNLGDGDIHDGKRRYHSSSYKMISDIQEILLGIGVSSTITKDTRTEVMMPSSKGMVLRKVNPVYSLEERTKQETTIRKGQCTTTVYSGFIGCVSVPSMFIVVRRNNRVAICGNTGEMGTTMFYDHNEHVPFFKATTEKLGNLLRDLDYRGQIDINCIVNEDGIWPLELTPRQGYPSSYIECELQEARLTDLIYACAAKLDFKNRVKSGWGMGVCLVGEGYPFWKEGEERLQGLPMFGLNRENIEHFHPYNLAYKQGKFQLTGSLIGCATGYGPTIRACQDLIYRDLIPQLYYPSMYYRTDIGDRVIKDLAKLEAWGWPMILKE